MRRTALWLLLLICGTMAHAQTAPVYPPIGAPVFFAPDANGAPLPGGMLYSFAAGSSTLQATYTDPSGATPNTNPVVLDSAGRAKIFLGPLSYKFVLTDANGVQQWTVDNISGKPPLAPVTSVFGRTGDVAATTGDYTCAQITGAACTSSLPTLYYQTLQLAGAAQTQEPTLNLLQGTGMTITCADNAANTSTDCTFAVPTAGTPRTCTTVSGATSCYRVAADGTVEAWGILPASFSSSSLVDATLTYPTLTGGGSVFTSLPTLTVTGSGQPGTSDDAYVTYSKNATLTGATIVARCALNIGGSGCSESLTATIALHWHAIGF